MMWLYKLWYKLANLFEAKKNADIAPSIPPIELKAPSQPEPIQTPSAQTVKPLWMDFAIKELGNKEW